MDGLWDNFQLLQASIPMLQPPSPCCNTTWSKEAIAAAAEMRSPDGPSRSPSTTFVCYPPQFPSHFFLELTSISYSTYEEWNSFFYVLSNAASTNTPFCLLLSSSVVSFWCRRVILLIIECVVHYWRACLGIILFLSSLILWSYLVTKKSFECGNENRKYFISHVSCSGQQII